MSFNPVQLKSALVNKIILDLTNISLFIISTNKIPSLKYVYRAETQSVIKLKGP